MFWRKVEAFFGVICITVYIAAAVYSFIFIDGALKEQRALNEREFTELREFAASAGVLGWTTGAFKDDILDAVTLSRTLQAVIITGPGSYALAVEKSQGLIKWSNGTPRIEGSFYPIRLMNAVPLRIEGQRDLSISAAASIIDFTSLLFILRKSLVAVLCACVISFIMLIVNMTTGSKEKETDCEDENEANNAQEKNANEEQNETVLQSSSSSSTSTLTSTSTSTSTSVASHDSSRTLNNATQMNSDLQQMDLQESGLQQMETQASTQNETVNISSLEDVESEVQKTENLPLVPDPDFAQKQNLSEEDIQEAFEEEIEEHGPLNEFEPEIITYESDPFGEFDEESGFVKKLTPELEKAEELEADLSLISALWAEPDASYRLLSEMAGQCFKRGSKIIEKDVPGIYIIALDTNIDEAFSSAKRLHREACALQERLGAPSALNIGISSRAGRVVHAERLINEAERALGKACEEPESPIVAFKVDLEKYKQFIASRV
jgi:hypothetical protein